MLEVVISINVQSVLPVSKCICSSAMAFDADRLCCFLRIVQLLTAHIGLLNLCDLGDRRATLDNRGWLRPYSG